MTGVMGQNGAAPTVSNEDTVLVTGGAGYIGSLLVRRLLDLGYRVRVLDRLMYGDDAIRELYGHPRLDMVVGDFRDHMVVDRCVAGVDAVLHLGAIVGDPACAIDEDFTIRTNFDATRSIAEACVRHGVRRMIFASTCSVYGASDTMLDESSALNPISLYANTKIAAEGILLDMRGEDFAPVILRFGTAYGLSPRPRFDLVVNLLAAKAVRDGQITIHGGEQWRPFVHVDDIARACIIALETPLAVVSGEIFNVGSREQNHKLGELGAIIQSFVPHAQVITNDLITDKRNYYVHFDKIKSVLGFVPEHTLVDGVREMKEAVDSGAISDWKHRYYNNHTFLSQIIAEAAIEPGQVIMDPFSFRRTMAQVTASASAGDG